ncbi:MAG: tRNA pseudouridine(38-40) synthase TruA [Planctomycetota bacterium]|nr:tRNA pseudouridine(38-40) synthase TruA [Planctomycetota bacterium]MDA1214201.1 tRNA pseudouridine(38-40) synthase TruA [Planctomycetota bacterium]
MRNIKLTLAYDGTEYAGWQIQSEQATIQEKLQQAIETLTGERAHVIASGRTDSGVHALGQVANFQTESRIPSDRWVPALNGELPPDIVVRHAEEVDAEFHATYAAKWKTYRYVIYTGDNRNPFVRRYSYHVLPAVDVQTMQIAAQRLMGTHDFRCFETDFPNRASSVRTIYALKLFRMASLPTWFDDAIVPQPEGPFIALEITADGFLYNMVRAIAGTLLQVGLGRWPVEMVPTILASGERKEAGPTAPACGLFLVHVEYEAEHP